MVEIGKNAGLGVCGQVIFQPHILRRFLGATIGGHASGDLLTVGVQGDEVPVAKLEAVVAPFDWITGSCSKYS